MQNIKTTFVKVNTTCLKIETVFRKNVCVKKQYCPCIKASAIKVIYLPMCLIERSKRMKCVSPIYFHSLAP